MHVREINTCTRCRESKRQCDKLKPSCTRCLHAGVVCSYSTKDDKYKPPENEDDITLGVPNLSSTPELDGLTALALEARGPSVPQEKPERIIKRRDRASLSCTRCHRLKIKCDKKQPCSRCLRSGHEGTCIYTHKIQKINQTLSPSLPCILAGEDPENVVVTWFLRRRGFSHWRSLLRRIESLSGIGSPPFIKAIREHGEGDCSGDLFLPGNFPFGASERIKYSSLDFVSSLLQASQLECEKYIQAYLQIYQVMYPIVDTDTFLDEVKQYWASPSGVNVCWMAQFLVVLGLGAFATSRGTNPAKEFFFAGEACLAKSPYMFRPTMDSLRTLCLMVVAKQVANATCWALDSCWNVMGIVVRLAMMLSLHHNGTPNHNTPNPTKKCRLRRRLWTLIVYLDIQLSLITGQLSLLPQNALLIQSDDDEPSSPFLTLDDCWHTILPEAFPIISHFLARINYSTDDIGYDEVLQYDIEIRQLMRRIAVVDGNDLLRRTLDIFFRRVLMVLHRQKALHPDAPTSFPTSYWSSLECSLALLVHHQSFTDQIGLQNNKDLVGRPFMLDFFAAALTSCIHLMRQDAPLAATHLSECMIPPRQTILDTLLSCRDIFSREESQSVCIRTGCRLLKAVLEVVPGASAS
ncbi:hypothetical protein CC78DRAFT_487067 [Lojkania enalia]|uniref:Zn(2)-C6 fungal-type domain-containing protein n=1 Tax=Lojkania enalia TaxID=147567 RepID=A0A9P4NA70_9PLEO|nr:hypothetical protein CC78DRAFT_487067 [Didymosphaeria enalia]